jgi:hypothetical protein
MNIIHPRTMLATDAIEALQLAHEEMRWGEIPQRPRFASTVLVLIAELAVRWSPDHFTDEEIDLIAETAGLATTIQCQEEGEFFE